jgi:hypothetical protein
MSSFYSKLYLYCHTLELVIPVTPRISCEVRLLSEPEVGILHEVWPVNLEEMKRRLWRGDQCYVCFADARLVHYSWVQYSGNHDLRDVGQTIEIQPGNCWIYHCRTAEWAKGQQIYPHVLTHILDNCKFQARHMAWIYTSNGNFASQNGITKAGFILYKQLAAVHLFGFHRALTSI